MTYQVRMTFARPEQLRENTDENGKRVVERIPSHPTRPARPYEVNSWWEDLTYSQFIDAMADEQTCREVYPDGACITYAIA